MRRWWVVLLCSLGAGCGNAEADFAMDVPSDTVMEVNGTRLFVHQEEEALRASEEFERGDPGPNERLLQLSFRAQLHDP